MAAYSKNITKDHSFIIRLIVATADLDCDVDACPFFLHFVRYGSGGEAGHGGKVYGEGLCVVDLLELCVGGQASLGRAEAEDNRGAIKGMRFGLGKRRWMWFGVYILHGIEELQLRHIVTHCGCLQGQFLVPGRLDSGTRM